MNLVTNASEAIGDRAGVIHLRTRVCALDAVVIVRDFPGQELAAGTFAMLEVADNGSGMEPETLERLFEPFFTTKFSGRGLGLSALRGILKGHHAGIRIDSEPGKGSTFRIYFPVSATTVTAVSDAKPPSPAPSQQGTILLVDDEPAVRASTAAMLNELGHEVVEAEDGLQALELYQGRLKEFTLVLLDLTMPRMSGHETLRELRKLNPDVKVILCSGYHEQEALREIRRDDLIGFLQKPFRYSDLRTALTQLP
jgi:CheY-like chemotaxis protein